MNKIEGRKRKEESLVHREGPL